MPPTPRFELWMLTVSGSGGIDSQAYSDPRELVAELVAEHCERGAFDLSDAWFWKGMDALYGRSNRTLTIQAVDVVSREVRTALTGELEFQLAELQEVRSDLFGGPQPEIAPEIAASIDRRSDILDHVLAAAALDHNPASFLQEVQTELEYLPGAMVSFATRDQRWFDAYVAHEDRGALADDQKQMVLIGGSAKFEESYASQDGISEAVQTALDSNYPKPEEEIAP